MDVGLQMIFATYGWSNVSDEQAWDEELRLARLAAGLGFDVLWSVEHHFNDYSFCPDNLQLMSYLAAECPEVGLGTAAVILPWHDPLRVAEQASVLDHLSRGRLRLGMGRGLARREFEAFRARAPVAAIGSSDFHGIGRLGMCRTYVFARDNSAEAVIEAIRAKRTVVYGRNGRAYGDPALIAAAAAHPRLRDEATLDRRPSWLDTVGSVAGVLGLLGLVVVRCRADQA